MKKKRQKHVSKTRRISKIPQIFSIVSITLGFIAAIIAGYIFLHTQKSNCANSISCISDLSGVYDTQETKGVFMGKSITVPSELAYQAIERKVLGEQTNSLGKNVAIPTKGSGKHIYVDLTYQRLYAFEGNTIVYNFPISSGKWYPTPTGEFTIWVKLRYTRMTGGNPAIGTYYSLPNVPYVMFFYNNDVSKSQGFSIHGAYWHNNFGHPMSHGCVNMKDEDAAQIYGWASPATDGSITYADSNHSGTPITIYGSPLEN